MAIRKVSGRQEVISTSPLTLSFDTLANDDGTVEAVVVVPQNAIVVGGSLTVDTAFDSTTSDVLDIGDGVDPDRYTATPIDLTSTGRTALDLTDYKYTAQDTIDVGWTAGSTGTATAGSARLIVQYIIDGRAAFSHGLDDRVS